MRDQVSGNKYDVSVVRIESKHANHSLRNRANILHHVCSNDYSVFYAVLSVETVRPDYAGWEMLPGSGLMAITQSDRCTHATALMPACPLTEAPRDKIARVLVLLRARVAAVQLLDGSIATARATPTH